MRLKVVSFNMKRTQSAKYNWNGRAKAIRAFFDVERPDIVGTQELLRANIDAARTLLSAYDWVGQGRKGGDDGEFTAIFYRKDRFRALDWGTFWLSKTPDVPGSRSWLSMFPRTCTWAYLESLQTGHRVCVYNTHLDHISLPARRNGLKLIRQHIQQRMPNCPDILLMGDFNAFPNSKALRHLRGERALVDSFSVDIANRPGRTYHAFKGRSDGQPIDYIFTSHSMKVEFAYVDRKRYDNRYPSDHYPLVVIAQLAANRALAQTV